ncbi:CW-type zinc-finger protein [Quillaja saponaria]|uniref:CW-type zinc-finger protein n=1 Tax=Quillaja saponaria TaxID=32244 RepID=A0AAD7PHG6_QUISA|nr:CW-type zinc-finger protein [Quillaja saponaria]
MEENTELEEGEACYYKDDDENIDPDIALSYIDEKIQDVLGHFQKDFEGGVSAQNLGAKFGGYGSFLPTYECYPSIWSCPKTPQRNHSTPRSPNNLSMETASHDLKAPNAPPSRKHGSASHNAHSLCNTKAPSGNALKKQDICVPSSLFSENCSSKDDKRNGSGNQCRYKVRLKVKSDNLALKNAAIYSGLGLEDSPSSSMGNSPRESGGVPPVSHAAAEDSPTSIIQGMTSLPIPGGVLISPLHDNLLYLIRKETICTDNKLVSSINGHQERSAMYESDSIMGNGKLSKEKKARLMGKSEKRLALKHMNGVYIDNGMPLHTKNSKLDKTLEGKDIFSNDWKSTPPLRSVCDVGEPVKVIGKASEFCKMPNKDGVNGRLFSSEQVKEESMESMSSKDCGKNVKQHVGSNFVEKVSEQRVANSHSDNKCIDLRNGGRHKACTISTSIKAESEVMKYKEDQDHLKQKTNQREKPSFKGKNKSIGDHGTCKLVTLVTKERFKADVGAVEKVKKNTGDGGTHLKSKRHRIKSQKDNKVGGHCRGSVKENNLEWTDTCMDLVEGPSGDRLIINANIDCTEEQGAYRVKLKERPSSNKVSKQSISRTLVTDASNTCLTADNKPFSEIVPAVSAPAVIEEHWVSCDNCEKWRLLPFGTKPEQLPDKWLCSMLNWLPGMNRCDISQEETTKVLLALYQIPVSESQTNMQNHATGTALGVSSSDVQHDLKHLIPDSQVMSNRGKKQYGSKEITKAGRSNKRNDIQESVKNRSLHENQHLAEVNLMKKSSSQHLSKLQDLVMEKHMPKTIGKQMNSGDGKHLKMKRKRDADQYGGNSTKSMSVNVYHVDKQRNLKMDLWKAGVNSKSGFPTKASVNAMQKYDEYCLSMNAKDKSLVSVKQGHEAQVSLDGGPSDVHNSIRKDCLIKKRKLKDWHDSERHIESFCPHDGKSCGEESVESGLTKEKKDKVSKSKSKNLISNDGDDNFNRKGTVTQIFLPGSKNHDAVGMGEVRSVDKHQQPRKNRKQIASQQSLDGRDGLWKDDALKDGLPVMSNFRRFSGREGTVEISLSVEVRKEKVSSDFHPEPCKFSAIENQNGEANSKVSSKTKTSSEVRKGHLLNGDTDTVEKHSCSANGTHTSDNCYHGDRVKKYHHESSSALQKSRKASSLRPKEDAGFASEFGRDKTKDFVSDKGYSKGGLAYESQIDPPHHASSHETRNDAKYSLPDGCKPKHQNDDTRKKNSVGQWTSDSGMETQSKDNGNGNSVLKMGAPRNANGKALQHNQNLKFEGRNKTDPIKTDSRGGKLKVLSSCEGEGEKAKLSVASLSAAWCPKEDVSNGHPAHASGNGNLWQWTKSAAGICSGVNSSSGNLAHDQLLTARSPLRTNATSQSATNALKEAHNLREIADRLKSSGFGFESNDAYIQAALKFLHGASLLESCNGASGKHEELNHMQFYSTSAKLFESCA